MVKLKVDKMQFIKTSSVFFLIVSFLILALGALIYLNCRNEVFNLTIYYNNLKAYVPMPKLSNLCALNNKLLIGSLPGLLWIVAAGFASQAINASDKISVVVLVVIGVFSEFLQKFNIITGTFDYNDIVFYLLGGVFWFLVVLKIKNINHAQ